MQYYNVNEKDESFQITKTNMGYQLSDFETKKMIGHNPKALETYIASFRKLYAESFVTSADLENAIIQEVGSVVASPQIFVSTDNLESMRSQISSEISNAIVFLI